MNIDVNISKYMQSSDLKITGIEYTATFSDDNYPGILSETAGIIRSDLPDGTSVDDMEMYVKSLIEGDINLMSVHASDLAFKYNLKNSTVVSTSLEPTPEEIRELMQPISKRQLRLTLVRNGISISELDNAISQMGDEAIIEWQDATEYNRLHPLLLQVAAYLELTPEQVDVMWQEALEA